MMDYKTLVEADSMHNTPPCYNIYMLGLVLKWLDSLGGVEGMEKIKTAKAKILYDFIEESKLFSSPVRAEDRSDMNVPFVTGSKELDDKFVAEAAANGFANLAGHRKVGGMRASIYNAMPTEGVKALVEFMKDFELKNK